MPRDRAGLLKFRIFRSLVTRILVGLPLGHHLDHDSTNFIFSSGYNNMDNLGLVMGSSRKKTNQD